MPDEQIIDVTKCVHFDKSDIPNGCTCYWDGECNHYCYYKKYTYKHQECEKLKQTLAEIKEIAEAESYLSPQSTRLLVHKILQKISEYKGDYNEKIR